RMPGSAITAAPAAATGGCASGRCESFGCDDGTFGSAPWSPSTSGERGAAGCHAAGCRASDWAGWPAGGPGGGDVLLQAAAGARTRSGAIGGRIAAILRARRHCAALVLDRAGGVPDNARMGDLVRDSLFSAVFAGSIVLLLCLAPLLAARGRTVIGVLLLLVPVGFVADVLVSDHSKPSKTEVVNPFRVVKPPAGEEGPHLFVLETVEAPPSHYHLFLAAIVAIPALLILLRRNRHRAAPNAVWHAML